MKRIMGGKLLGRLFLGFWIQALSLMDPLAPELLMRLIQCLEVQMRCSWQALRLQSSTFGIIVCDVKGLRVFFGWQLVLWVLFLLHKKVVNA